MTKRQDILQFAKANPIGIELGVAEGVFSQMVLSSYPVKHWYGVDMWCDGKHDVNEYKRALNRLWPYQDRNTILKMTFKEALPLFSNEFFDIIYIDGYAHTGQDNGQTLRDWWPKLKPGGVFSGDDYDSSWPKTVSQVNTFCESVGKKPCIHNFDATPGPWSRYPSWYIIK